MHILPTPILLVRSQQRLGSNSGNNKYSRDSSKPRRVTIFSSLTMQQEPINRPVTCLLSTSTMMQVSSIP